MNSTLVIYKSKYGATKKYADMLGEELKCDIVDAGDFRASMLKGRDTVVFAGGVYAGGISGMELMRKNCDRLEGKTLAVFCVGVSSFDEKAVEEIRRRSLKGALRDVPMFYGRGAWDESRMTFKDRAMCKMLRKMVAKRDPSEYEPWMATLMSAVGKRCDWTDMKYLKPLIEYIRKS